MLIFLKKYYLLTWIVKCPNVQEWFFFYFFLLFYEPAKYKTLSISGMYKLKSILR